MKVLICAGDVGQVGEIRDVICEVLEEKMATDAMPLNYDSDKATFAAETKRGSRSEKRVYLIPDQEPFEYSQRLERLARRLAERLSLPREQIIVCSKFPG